MRRNYIPFIAGMSTMLLLVGLVGASMAEETSQPAVPQSGTLNGQVAYGEAGVALFGKEQVPAGTAWTTEDGAQVPTVLTYTDENGEDHYFVSAETTAEVLDMVYGAVYREDLNCIDFGTEAAVDAAVSYTHLDVYKRQGPTATVWTPRRQGSPSIPCGGTRWST